MEGCEQCIRKKVENSKVDRLSNLPDPIIHHILSLMETKYAVQTCILSKKWTHHWTHIHCLYFDEHNDFERLKDFERFVHHVLRHLKLSKLSKLIFYSKRCSDKLMERVFNYAKLHNIEELDTDRYFSDFTECFFECQTLITLKIEYWIDEPIDFASLRTLELFHAEFYPEIQPNDFFLGCLNLRNLVITECFLHGKSFNINASQLESLKISGLECMNNEPKNGKLVVSAPKLNTFYFEGEYGLQLRMDNCRKLEKVSIHMYPSTSFEETNDWKQVCISEIPRMVEKFSQAKFLSLSVKFHKWSKEKLISYCRQH